MNRCTLRIVGRVRVLPDQYHRALSSIRGISTLNHWATESYTTTTFVPNSRCLNPALSRLPVQLPISLLFCSLSPSSTSRLFRATRLYADKDATYQDQDSLQCDTTEEIQMDDTTEEEEEMEANGWEEDDDDDYAEPQVHFFCFSTDFFVCWLVYNFDSLLMKSYMQVGDGGDGGGVVFQGVHWGERALSMAREVLLQFGDDLKLFAFKTTPRGYIYVRLDKVSNQYGCPSMEELESYSQEYKKRLDEVGALGEIPDNLALEVSSPSAERLLKVPDDLPRFKDVAMRVSYVESLGSNCQEQSGVFYLESMEMDSKNCVWKLADVKENRDPESKGRPLSRKRRDWRLQLPFEKHKKVILHVEL
ncbi:hypothetical protein K2173_015199 [Erythroxylum novogranatense]|uniref:DUF7912 domain-containing protein n=1 Tax=Erythroxylum novogranatense TaxID=1862640 RepID=A0AAV8T1I2_9ROSI|nr:hypothetical protein K2173_015199 [Erythroxylum novogranatense]